VIALTAASLLHATDWVLPWAVHAGADELSSAEFFEKEVRPLLIAKCQKCHGGAKTRGGLLITGRDLVLKGGGRGPAAVPGKPHESLLIEAVEHQGELKMPPQGKLSRNEIDRLKRWIALGLPWPDGHNGSVPATGVVSSDDGRSRNWWAFEPVRAAPAPQVNDSGWPKSEIDRFILAELERRGMAPSLPADRRTLLRRATFDLTGLPATPEDVDSFLADGSPDAFAKVVDRLLASPAYGERWARHWLDVVRYTDYFYPEPTAHPRAALFELFEAWRYRDWIVAAFRGDMPYDQFVVHQLAGDLLPGPEAVPDSAPGLFATSVTKHGASGHTTGRPVYAGGLVATGFLALSVFDNGDADKIKIVADIVDDQIDVVGKAFLGITLACARCHDHKFDPITQRDYYGLAGIFHSTRILSEVGGVGDHTVALRVPLVPPPYLERRGEQLKRLPEPPRALAAQEGGTPGGMFAGIQDVPLHIRGSYSRLGPVVPRHLPEFLGEKQPPIRGGSGRLELARWIAQPANPLTARVLVNRVWQHHFSGGLVRTPSNLGKLGEPPSHPQLLDWLADRFVRDGWSIKRLHRRILLSAAYQQSSVASAESLGRDPENRWLGRMSPRRLEAEAIRDSMLHVAGQLDWRPCGAAARDLNRPRRSLYVQTVRQDRGNFSSLFDSANPEQSVEKRSVSTVAPQALFLLNSSFVQVQARHVADRLTREVPLDEMARIDRAYRLLFGRPPRAEEIDIGLSFLAGAAARGAGSAWADYAHVLLCSNEFIYID